MRTYDLTPFYRSTVGFDRFFSLLDQATADGSPGYPPYNIERTGENDYRITVAVSGFSQGELSIVAKENTLTIKGEKSANENGKDKSEVLYRGIAARAFERAFQLADFVQVKNASLENGLLHVDLVREIPEAKKPRSIPISDQQRRRRRWSTARPRRPPRNAAGFRQILAEHENAPGNRGVFCLRPCLRGCIPAKRSEELATACDPRGIALRALAGDRSLTPAPAPSAFPASAGSAARALPRRRRARRRGRAHPPASPAPPPTAAPAAARGLGGQRLDLAGMRRRRLSAPAPRGVRLATCGIERRRPRRAPDRAGRRRPGRAIGRRQILVEIVAHPVGRHEADDPPVAGIDHQPAVVAAAVDHRDRVDEAALLRDAERRKPALADHACRPPCGGSKRRPVARHRRFRRHRRIGPADVGHRRIGRPAGS